MILYDKGLRKNMINSALLHSDELLKGWRDAACNGK